MDLNNQYEGLVTVEVWDGDPKLPTSKLKKKHVGMNALVPTFVSEWGRIAQQKDALYITQNEATAHLSPEYIAEVRKRAGSGAQLRMQTNGGVTVYMSELDEVPDVFVGTRDVIINATTGMQQHVVNTLSVLGATNEEGVRAKLRTFVFNDLYKGSVSVDDSNIADIVNADRDYVDAVLTQYTKYYSADTNIRNHFPASGVYNSNDAIETPLLRPILNTGGKRLEWITTFDTTNTYTPCNHTTTPKVIGITLSDASLSTTALMHPVTYHKLPEGFTILGTDYLKIRYTVLVKTAIQLPEHSAPKDVELFGKSNRMIEIDYIDTPEQMAYDTIRFPTLIPEVRQYLEGRINAVHNNEEITKTLLDRWSVYGSGTWSKTNDIFNHILGIQTYTGYAVAGSNTTQYSTSGNYIMSNYKDYQVYSLLKQEVLDTFHSSDLTISVQNTLKLMCDTAVGDTNTAATSIGRRTPIVALYGLCSNVPTANTSILRLPKANNNDAVNTDYIKNNTISIPANASNVWQAKGLQLVVGNIMGGINLYKLILFRDTLEKDHLHSFTWKQAISLASTVTDAPDMIDVLRESYLAKQETGENLTRAENYVRLYDDSLAGE